MLLVIAQELTPHTDFSNNQKECTISWYASNAESGSRPPIGHTFSPWVENQCNSRQNSDELKKLTQKRLSRGWQSDSTSWTGAQFLVRVPRRKTVFSVPAVSLLAVRTTKEDSQ